MNLRHLIPLLAGLLLLPMTASAQTTHFTYQGRLTDNNFAANGNYDMRFTLYSAASGSAAVGSSFAVNPVNVASGLFTALLDFGVNFTGADRWLQIEVRPSGSTGAYTLLNPRQRITSTPYANRAATATALAGSITASQISGGTIDISLLPASLARLDQPATFTQTLNLNTAQQTPVSITGSSSGGTWINLGNTSGTAASTWNLISTGTGNGEGAGKLLFRDSDNSAVRFAISDNGNVGIGTVFPRERLHVEAPDVSIALKNSNDGLGTYLQATYHSLQLGLYNTGAATDSGVPAGAKRAFFGVESFGRVGSLTNNAGAPVFRNLLDDGAGRVGIGTATPEGALLDVEGDIRLNDHDLRLRSGDDGTNGLGYRGASRPFGTQQPDGPVLYGFQGGILGCVPSISVLKWTSQGLVTVGGGGSGSPAGRLEVKNAAGAANIVLDGSSGDATVKTVTITGGSDIAEPFHMSGGEIPAGSVVVIDEENPGKLKQSDHAYDTRVAGIISGAQGVNPGLALHQAGVLEGGQHVALTGRVYAMADAGDSPIRPGDLLTTSSRPGHAMKASNRELRDGAVIGKAMTGLDSGTGFVLVLVNLQ